MKNIFINPTKNIWDNIQNYGEITNLMFVALDKKGVVTHINNRGAKILGYPKKYIIGKSWF